ncbi:MAG: DUF2779 domain-containing protein [bacterium]|nr:DUF2779 domain-containing protein [bacterium]
MPHLLSKSRYLSGLQCAKRLWIEIHQPELLPKIEPSQQKIFDQGTEVGKLARERFPGGVLIGADHQHISDALSQTDAAIAGGAEILFEAAFTSNQTFVRPDIIRKIGSDRWEIIEVKSSTQVKPENLHDVAIQTYTVQGAGLNVVKSTLMHLNTECVYPDLSNLFTLSDITDEVAALLPVIPQNVAAFRMILLADTEPDVPIGSHCSSPYGCPLMDQCWAWLPEPSIFNIPGLKWTKKDDLLLRGLLELEQLPDDFKLNDAQDRYIRSYLTQSPVIDWEAIREILSSLQYPLYFLDFETDNPAVPRLDGMHPYGQFPFQFSCHILQENGELAHAEYLHLTTSDPRADLCQALLKTLGDKGTIVAYNSAFEISRLKNLATWFPQYQPRIDGIIRRMWDQLIIFRQYYSDYRFGGSNSIKNVLPVLIPSMNYQDLEVGEGGAAQIAWNEMIRLPDSPEKDKLIGDLKTYCGQDTLAMVEIHRVLAGGW